MASLRAGSHDRQADLRRRRTASNLERLQRYRGTARREERSLARHSTATPSVPGALGLPTSWRPPTVRRPRSFYVTARDQCDIFSTAPQPYEAGHAFYGSAYFPSEEAEPYLGFLKAIDPATGEIKGKFQHTSPTWSGVAVHCRRSRLHRRCRGQLHRLRRLQSQTPLAFPDGRSRLRSPDSIRHRWQGVCNDRRRQRRVYLWPTLVCLCRGRTPSSAPRAQRTFASEHYRMDTPEFPGLTRHPASY